MENRSHALIAIIFLAVFAVGAVAVVWWMMSTGVTRVPYILESHTSVGGLGPGAEVQFDGVKVGVVKNIKIDPKTHRLIRVKIGIKKSFPVPKDSYATTGSTSLVGPTVVTLHLGKSGQAIHTSAKHPAVLKLKESGIGALMDKAQKIVDKAKQTLDAVQKVVSKQNVQRVSATLENIRKASSKLVKLENSIQPAAKQMPGLIADTHATVNKAKGLLANADQLVVAARAPLSSVGRAADSTASLTKQLDQQTAPKLDHTLSQLQLLSQRLQALVEELKRAPQSVITGPPKPQPGPGEKGHQH
jgi:phospholipid/cholesterol/gamma-HCH transport system substrate-binding protein